MLLETLRADGLLSFAPGSPEILLRPLNVIVGPNGSGKSNLIEIIELLRATSTGLAAAIRDGGGVHEWLWKGNGSAPGTLEARLARPGQTSLRYWLTFAAAGARIEIVDEGLEEADKTNPDAEDVLFYYRLVDGRPSLRALDPRLNAPEGAIRTVQYIRETPRERLAVDESVLSQRKDPDFYPELSWCAAQFSRIQTFREWSFGRSTALRQPQPADLPDDALLPDARNLGLILNQLELSDASSELSTLLRRFLPLVCIEEPELGLHPDALSVVADMLVSASARTQLIVTTHSDALVSALTEHVESVLVCEYRGGTQMARLDAGRLQHWLERYRLGDLWRMGELGGNP
jgi:predicted ATPase